MSLTYWIFILLILGIINAGYLYWQHIQYVKASKTMVCPIGGKCEQVVESKYGTTFGIKNEIFGLLYYSALIVGLLLFLFYPPLANLSKLGIIVAAMLAGAFSIYLLFIQAFILQNYCSWCLIAAFINLAILILVILRFL